MVHPATQRAVWETLTALNTAIDVGFVFPPRTEGERGCGVWTGKDLSSREVISMLARATAANAQGAHIYIRLGPSARTQHSGTIMLDDLNAEAVTQLTADGLEPCLVIETSPGNHQAWIRLIGEGDVPYPAVHSILRKLASRYEADPRAVSPLQPGRIPGFTNRKPKYLQTNGNFPFVRLIGAHPGMVASAGPALVSRALDKASNSAQAGRAGGAAPETPHKAARSLSTGGHGVMVKLDAIYQEQQARIQCQVSLGYRPVHAGTRSEIDFAVAVAAIKDGIDPAQISAWLETSRPEKHSSYASRTVGRAIAAVTPTDLHVSQP